MANKVECDRCHRTVEVNKNARWKRVGFADWDSVEGIIASRDLCETCTELFFIFMTGKPTLGVSA